MIHKFVLKIGIIAVVCMSVGRSVEASKAVNIAPMDLHSLMQEALEQNPDIRAAESKWKSAKKKILASWALPDPMLGIDIIGEETETRVGSQENRISLSQEIPFPLKLWKQRQAAKQRAEALEQEYLAVRRQILSELKQNYYSLYWVDASLDVVEEVHTILKNFEGAAQSRYANRSGSQRDAAKAQAEVSMTLQHLYELEQKREMISARLNVILGRGPFEEYGKAVKPQLKEVTQTFIELINAAAQHRESVKAAEARLKEKQYHETLAKLQNIPNVKVGFTYTWVENGGTSAMADGKDSWMIPLRMNVPLWQNRILPEIQAAKEDTEAFAAELEAHSNQTFYEVKEAHVRYKTSTKVALLYETAVIPQAELALNSDEAGYESGKTDFLNLLDSERLFLNAKLSHVRIYTEALKSIADLERVTGTNLTGEMS